MLPIWASAIDTEYVMGYAVGSVAEPLTIRADADGYQGPSAINDYRVTAAGSACREELFCAFK